VPKTRTCTEAQGRIHYVDGHGRSGCPGGRKDVDLGIAAGKIAEIERSRGSGGAGGQGVNTAASAGAGSGIFRLYFFFFFFGSCGCSRMERSQIKRTKKERCRFLRGRGLLERRTGGREKRRKIPAPKPARWADRHRGDAKEKKKNSHYKFPGRTESTDSSGIGLTTFISGSYDRRRIWPS